MSRKPKFKPKITRVKLNPEQAVLVCDCYSVGMKQGGLADSKVAVVCYFDGPNKLTGSGAMVPPRGIAGSVSS